MASDRESFWWACQQNRWRFAAAERGKSDKAEQAENVLQKLLAEGRQQVAELVANADKRAAQIVEEARSQASEEAVRIVAQARAEWKLKPTVHAKHCVNK